MSIRSRLSRALRPWIRGWREWRTFRLRRSKVTLDLVWAGGRIETCSAGPDGIVAVSGWSDNIETFKESLSLAIDGVTHSPHHVFRVPRPEFERQNTGRFRGVVAEWVLEPSDRGRTVSVLFDEQEVHALIVPARAPVPYSHLHLHDKILARHQIYGSGMPVHVVSEEVLYLACQLPPPVLDFGCGGGALVRALRREGVEAYGLELDDARIRTHLLEEVSPYVTLYDGQLPAPFSAGQFESVVCSEVLEHIPDAPSAIAELARIARSTLLITVPDASGIPRGYPHTVVPWHLLEATHVNFFTQHSLAAALAPFVASLEVSRIGAIECERLLYYNCLAAVATLARRPATQMTS